MKATLNPKGIALVLGTHARLASTTGESRFRDSAQRFVDWLESRASRNHSGAGWGYPFPWANRDFFVAADAPCSVVTAFVGHALLDCADRFGFEKAKVMSQRAGEFLVHELQRLPGADGAFCFSYTPFDRRAVHNANLLVASLLARLAAVNGNGGWAEDALRATRLSAGAQKPDGSWSYGTAARDGWTDSFHTSYNLVALQEIRRRLGTAELDDVIERGLAFWQKAFFRGPAVGLYPGSRYPIDLYAVAHAILTLLAFHGEIPDAVTRATRLAEWSLREMRSPNGFFYYRKHRFFRNRAVYMRWTQAWMLRALAELAAAATVPSPAATGAAVDTAS